MMTRMRGATVPRAGDRAAGAAGAGTSSSESIEEPSPSPERPPKRTKLSGKGMRKALGGRPPALALLVRRASDVLGHDRQMRARALPD